jgi:hypothetical protein
MPGQSWLYLEYHMDLSEQTQIAEAVKRVQGRETTVPLKQLFRDALF